MIDKYINESGKIKDKKIHLRFTDSTRFMTSSLDSLSSDQVGVSKVKCDCCEFTNTDEGYIARGKWKDCELGYGKCKLNKDTFLSDFADLKVGHTDEQFRLLLRKGVYPYEYISSWDRFKETRLPSKEAFYSSLNMRGISKYDYKHAQIVWKQFNVKNLGEYHDLYLKTDVLLLSNVFETFRNNCLEYYKLDPAHFYTLPGLAWQACLKETGVRLELLTDPDMLLMFERGVRGSITQAAHRYAEANNKYMGKKHNPKENSSFLQYLDANNLYGWAMCQPLPTGGFMWVIPSHFTPDKIDSYANCNKGYLLEVDVESFYTR